LTGHFLCWARRLFFFSACCCSAASVRATFLFVLSGRFSTALSARQNFLFGVVRSHPAARTEPFLWCPVSSCCACRNFFFSLIGHFCTAVWAPCCRLFLFVRSLLLTAMHACQGRQLFFSVQSLPVNSSCAHSFFLVTATLYYRVRSFFVFVSGRCLPF